MRRFSLKGKKNEKVGYQELIRMSLKEDVGIWEIDTSDIKSDVNAVNQ